MRKGVVIGCLTGIAVVGGLFGWWVSENHSTNELREVGNMSDKLDEEKNPEVDEYVGEPLPNIINRAGTIKAVNKDSVIINGPEDEDVIIYIKKDTEIYGADGKDRELADLKKGMYITVDIDGDLVNDNQLENGFDALIIYISGK